MAAGEVDDGPAEPPGRRDGREVGHRAALARVATAGEHGPVGEGREGVELEPWAGYCSNSWANQNARLSAIRAIRGARSAVTVPSSRRPASGPSPTASANAAKAGAAAVAVSRADRGEPVTPRLRVVEQRQHGWLVDDGPAHKLEDAA